MNAEELKTIQTPIKQKYKEDPAKARITLRADGVLGGQKISCKLESGKAAVEAGLHPATGGDGSFVCSGDLLLESLVACFGVTLKAVATAMGLSIRQGRIQAEGDLDFRGTLGIEKDVPVGFTQIRLAVHLDTGEPAEKIAKLLAVAERYCVVFQTLKSPPKIEMKLAENFS